MFDSPPRDDAPPADVLVVGAGLSGLTAAFLLARNGLRVTVLEAASRPGGVIGSRRRDGVLIESGPNSMLDTSPQIGALLQAAGIAHERLDAAPIAKRRYVLRDGRLMALPLSPPAFLRTPLFSPRAKLRLLREPFVGRARVGVEESVSAFVRRRLGEEFLDYAVEPFVAGVYAGNPDELALSAAFPRLFALERDHGGLVRGLLFGARARRGRADTAKNRATSFSFRDGMQTLTDALARCVGAAQILCDARALAIDRGADGTWSVVAGHPGGRFVRYGRALVLAVPAFEAAPLLAALAPGAAEALGGIAYPPVASVVSAFARSAVAHPLDGFGFLAPRKERPAILGTLFSSSMFAGRSPEGVVAMTTFVGGRRNPALAQAQPEAIAAAVGESLAATLGAQAPAWSEVTRWPRAIPQYTLGHAARLAALASAERALPGLAFCANYRGGVSAGDCIAAAHEVARRVADVVGAPWRVQPPAPEHDQSARGA